MCYSAEVEADYKKYVRVWGADISIAEFFRLYWEGTKNSRIKTPKAMDAAFSNPQTPEEREVKWQIDERNANQVTKLEQDIFKQKKRLADAELGEHRLRPHSPWQSRLAQRYSLEDLESSAESLSASRSQTSRSLPPA